MEEWLFRNKDTLSLLRDASIMMGAGLITFRNIRE